MKGSFSSSILEKALSGLNDDQITETIDKFIESGKTFDDSEEKEKQSWE